MPKKPYFIILPKSFLELVPADNDHQRYRGDQAAYNNLIQATEGIGMYRSKLDALNRFLRAKRGDKKNDGSIFYPRLHEHVEEYVRELSIDEYNRLCAIQDKYKYIPRSMPKKSGSLNHDRSKMELPELSKDGMLQMIANHQALNEGGIAENYSSVFDEVSKLPDTEIRRLFMELGISL